jgi:hypothetical protein
MKKVLWIALLYFTPAILKAQDESLFNRINGINFNDNIYIRLHDKNMEYFIDKENIWHVLDENAIFNINNRHGNNFKVFLQFYNPLKYTFKSTQSDIDDPAYKEIGNFIAKLPAQNFINAAASESVAAANSRAELADKADKNVVFKKSVLLYSWMYEFTQVIDDAYVNKAANKQGYAALITKINKIADIENYLFGKIGLTTDDTDAKTVSEWMKYAYANLYETDNDYMKFNVALTGSGNILIDINKIKESTEGDLKKIISALSERFDDEIGPLIGDKKKRSAFKAYSLGASQGLTSATQSAIAANNTAITQLDALNKRIKSFSAGFSGEPCGTEGKLCNIQWKQDYDFKLSWKSVKMKQFVYETSGLNLDGTESKDHTSKTTFVVGKRLGVYPFVSTGVLLTDFKYPNYAVTTTGGINSVALVDYTHVRVRPAVFLNLLISSWDPVYPFVQVGITTGKNDVLVPLGLGASLGSSFSLSGGPILGYRKDLTNLAVNGPVKDDAALQADLSNKGFVSWYFSLTYNIGKK